jgi:hypothetical protein
VTSPTDRGDPGRNLDRLPEPRPGRLSQHRGEPLPRRETCFGFVQRREMKVGRASASARQLNVTNIDATSRSVGGQRQAVAIARRASAAGF